MQKLIIGALAFAAQAEALRLSTLSDSAAKYNVGPTAGKKIDEGAFKFIADEGQELNSFVEYVAKYAKTYGTSQGFNQRLENFKQNNKKIKEANDIAVASGKTNTAMMDHNHMSDLSEAEIAKRFGLMTPTAEYDADVDQQYAENKQFFASLLQWLFNLIFGPDDGEDPIDDSNVEEGFSGETVGVDSGADYGTVRSSFVDYSWATQPVLDQGQCGSCWAFGANTVLEATDLIFQDVPDDEKARKNLSMQYPVSCSNSRYLAGCNGGNAEPLWRWYQDYGTVDRIDYPYSSGSTGRDGSCQATEKMKDYGLVTGWRHMRERSSILLGLETRPIAGAFGVSQDFAFYSFGLIPYGSNYCVGEGPERGLNHMMAITGHDDDGAGGTYEVQKSEAFAIRQNGDGTCPDGPNGEDSTPYPERPGYCIYYVYTTETEFFDPAPFFKIQNSWGADWGDHGFAYMEDVSNEYGVCNVYLDVQWVETANSYYPES